MNLTGNGMVRVGGMVMAILTLVGSTLAATVSVKDFGAKGDGVTDDTAAFLAAEAALPQGAVGGGVIFVPSGIFRITGWAPVVKNLKVVGEGQYNSTIKGSGPGDYTVRLTAQTRGMWENLSLDGGNVKAAALQIGPGDASGFTFVHVRFIGGAVNTLVIGDTETGSDISENTFVGCSVSLGDNGTGAALTLRGNNTGNITFFGGRISTANSTNASVVAVDIDDGAQVTFYQTNLLGLSDGVNGWAILARSGCVKMFGGHVEARGLIHTLATDPRTDATTNPHLFYAISCATPSGANTVYHEAPRTLMMSGSRLGGHFRVGTAATAQAMSNTFAPGSDYVLAGNARLLMATGRLTGTKTWDPPRVANGSYASTTVAVKSAAIGDTVAVGLSQPVPAGALLVGAVTGVDTVTVTLMNQTGSRLDLASGTLRVDVWNR